MTRSTLCTLLAALAASGALADLAGRWGGPGAAGPRSAARRRGAVALLARLGRAVARGTVPDGLEARLVAAGRPAGLTPRDVVALKAGAGLLAAAGVAPLVAALPARPAVLLLATSAGGAFLAPEAWLRRRARARAAAMQRELGDVLDLLRVAVEAGLPVNRALAEVGRRHAGALAQELRATATAIELGVPRAGALQALALRAPLPAIAGLTAAIDRAERHGAPLGHALQALARDARADRGRALAEHAAKAAPKIQLAVALLLVPAAMLVVAAGAISGFG
jgi:tight adherence protein C